MAENKVELVTKITITGAKDLDPITVYFEDLAPGQGKVIIACYNQAWTAYWGAMGVNTVMQFFKSCGPDYLAGCLLRGNHLPKSDQPNQRRYLARIACAIQEEMVESVETAGRP